jgi:hypothetical protein
MPELTVFELIAWPALISGFMWLRAGRRQAVRLFPALLGALVLALWIGSAAGGANRVMLLGLAQTIAWTIGIAIPVGLYARLIMKARRKAKEQAGE